jgi:hypothetical protein
MPPTETLPQTQVNLIVAGAKGTGKCSVIFTGQRGHAAGWAKSRVRIGGSLGIALSFVDSRRSANMPETIYRCSSAA